MNEPCSSASDRAAVRGVACAAVHAGEEDCEEDPPRHCVQEDPARGVRAQQLRHGAGRRDLPRREPHARAERAAGGVRAAARGELPHGGRTRTQVSHEGGSVKKALTLGRFFDFCRV